jgi:hypothetical protein
MKSKFIFLAASALVASTLGQASFAASSRQTVPDSKAEGAYSTLFNTAGAAALDGALKAAQDFNQTLEKEFSCDFVIRDALDSLKSIQKSGKTITYKVFVNCNQFPSDYKGVTVKVQVQKFKSDSFSDTFFVKSARISN